MFGSPLWGALSDQIGRRPVILVGLLGDFIFINLFGTAKNIATSLIFRFLHGLSSGNIAVAKTYLADVTDSTNESAAFGLIGLTFGVGVVIGPVIGGFLSRPAVHFPQYVSSGSLLDRYPYLLPCLVVSIYIFIDLIFAFFFLDESKPRYDFSTREQNLSYAYGITDNASAQESGVWIDSSAGVETVSVAPSDVLSVREQEKNFLDRNLLESFERQVGITPRMSQSLFSSIPMSLNEFSPTNRSLRSPLLGSERSRDFTGLATPSTRSIRSRRGRERREHEWDDRLSWSNRESYTEQIGPLLTETILEPEDDEIDKRSKALSSSQRSLSISTSIPEDGREEDNNNNDETEYKGSQVRDVMEEDDWFYSDEYPKNRGISSAERRGSESSSFVTYGLSGSLGATATNLLSPALRSRAPSKAIERLRIDEEDAASTVIENNIEETPLFSPDEEGTILPEPTGAIIENRTFRQVLIVAVLISFTLMAGDEVIPIWASTQPSFGGLGFSSTDIGLVQAISGMTTILVALYIFPFIARRLGVVKTIRLGLFVGSLDYLLPAIITSFGWSRKNIASWLGYASFDIFLAFFEQCCWAGIALIVKNSVHPSSVGIALGLAQGLQSAGFAAGPVIGGSLFASAISLNLPFPFTYGRSFFYLESGLLLMIYIIAGGLPPWPWKIEQSKW
ncbi:protein zinc induced facilitator-like 1 [Galdieria sulphuraria]|nr:protein zinc induced facilitator-like 1 [Galdieria sulphuraria]